MLLSDTFLFILKSIHLVSVVPRGIANASYEIFFQIQILPKDMKISPI